MQHSQSSIGKDTLIEYGIAVIAVTKHLGHEYALIRAKDEALSDAKNLIIRRIVGDQVDKNSSNYEITETDRIVTNNMETIKFDVYKRRNTYMVVYTVAFPKALIKQKKNQQLVIPTEETSDDTDIVR
jgi:hypothetical protein